MEYTGILPWWRRESFDHRIDAVSLHVQWTLSKPEDEAAFCTRACASEPTASTTGLSLTESADTPCIVISVDYRLAPEHPYPAPVEDAEEVLRWVSTEGVSSLKINKDKIAVGGLSA